MSALVVTNLSKTYLGRGPAVKALNDVTLVIPEGAIYGLLGPNGAGKSTLISIMSGTLAPTSGTVDVFGVNVTQHSEAAKRMMGIVPQEIVVEPAFTVEEVLYYYSGMFGLPAAERLERITEVLTDLDLLDKRHDRANRLSGGMKRRLMIAKAVMHKPKFLILDEPTAGVDVALRQRIWDMVRRLNAAGTTILFTTHYLEEAEQLCESIALIDHGVVIKEGKLKDIQKDFSVDAIHFELYTPVTVQLDRVRQVGTEFELSITDLTHDMARVISFYGDNIKSIRKDVASLEQIFLDLTGK